MSHNNNTDTSSSGKSRLLSEDYIIIKKIGSGSFGEVYLAEHKDGGYAAAKVEDKMKPARILNEYKIYKFLNKSGFTVGLPKIYDFIETAGHNIMFMQLLGSSLEDLFNTYNRLFSLQTVLLIATQLIDLLKKLHTCHLIHRDIKPNNFLIGREDKGQIYMMDFGLSKKYTSKGKHIQFKDNKSLIGTARYASTNMHMGIEPTRRDDLESVGYMLIYFLKGKLPWQGLQKKKGVGNLEQIGQVKIWTSLNNLCSGLPDCFKDYLTYCKNLRYDQKPNYDYLIKLFNTTAEKMNIEPKFIWT